MSTLNWLIQILSKSQPERAAALADLTLPDDDAHGWTCIAQVMEMTSAELFSHLQHHTLTPCANLSTAEKGDVAPIKESIARRFGVVACGQEGSKIKLACTQPFNEQLNHEISFSIGQKAELLFAPPEAIDNAINLIYALRSSSEGRNLWISEQTLSETANPHEAIERISMLLLDEAVKKNASDLHLQSFLGGGLVRFRVDGQLIRGPSLPRKVQDAVLRFIMNRAHLDTSNHSTPQDGRIQMHINDQNFDLRISVLPSHDSRRLVIRLLNQSREFSLSNLGYPLAEQHALERLCQESRGLILFTGPTGSGKTTSLYTLLSSLNTPSRNIMTAEDPVEYRIPGISQIEVDLSRGRGFDTILKSMLRQDPDIILIGEIRDAATLQTAMQAVMTGHLVFATLHTSDVPGTIRRLLDLEVTEGQLADGLKGVIAQRMARKLCTECAEPIQEMNHLEQLFFDTTREQPALREKGCEHCNYTGFKDRFPLLEVYEPSPDDVAALRQECYLSTPHAEHARTMNVIATEAVISGVTSIMEVTRVLGADYWRAFNALVMQDALSQARQGLSEKQETSLQLIGADQSLIDALVPLSPYPVITAEGATEAAEQLHQNSGVFAQLIMLPEHEDPSQLLAELRKHLAWAGLPTAFIVSNLTPALEQLFEQFNITRYLTLPVQEQALKQLTTELIAV